MTGTLHDEQYTLYLAEFLLEWEIFQTKVIEKIKTHILWSLYIFLNHAVYEIMWKNTAEGDKAQMPIWRLHVALLINKLF